MNAYTVFAFDGAMTTSIRPHGPFGSPAFVAAVNFVQVVPPSAER